MRDIKHVTHFVLFQTKVDAPFRGTVVAPQTVLIEDLSREFSMKSFVLLLFSFVLCETKLDLPSWRASDLSSLWAAKKIEANEKKNRG
jgi:hypothetical protein